MFVTDSLFSLEFTVNKLTITPGVSCRFPSVAFRFLDFPTIAIDLLDEPQRNRLRTKLNIDPEFQVAGQFKEFQDKSGYYVFNTGKSCLYRIAPDTLRSLLAQVPLYIIVADGYTEPTTLVGSSILPLQEAIDDVYEQLLQDGVSVPASSGVKSTLSVYNLMGHAIGHIEVGCRLNSLGMALLSHLPASSVAAHQQYQHGLYIPSLTGSVNNEERHVKETDLLEDQAKLHALTDLTNSKIQDYPIEHKEKSTQVKLPHGKSTQTAPITDGTERLELKKEEKKVESIADTDEGIELMVPDIYCPPPLYYNKQSHDQPVIAYQPPAASLQRNSSISGDEAVESEFGKLYPEIAAELAAPKDKTTPAKSTAVAEIPDALSIVMSTIQPQSNGTAESSDGFPLLNALLTELLKIKGQRSTASNLLSSSLHPQQSQHVTSTPVRVGRSTHARRKSSPSPKRAATPQQSSPHLQASPSTPVTGRTASPSNIPRRMSSPSGLQRSLSNKSLKKGSGPLVFGYTNTQKLRLSKTNPQLLRVIEQQEAEERAKKGRLGKTFTVENTKENVVPKLKLKFGKGKRKSGAHSFRSYTSQQPLDISTEMGRLEAELAQVKKEIAEHKAASKTPRLDSGTAMTADRVNFELGVTRILTPKGKVLLPKPSLTPGRSQSALSNRTSRDADLSTVQEYPSQSFQSSGGGGVDSRRSLEIHLPTPQLEDQHGSSQSDDNTDHQVSLSERNPETHRGDTSRLDDSSHGAAADITQASDTHNSPNGADYDYGLDSFDSED